MAREEIYSPRDWAVHPLGFDPSSGQGNALLPQMAPVPLPATTSELSGPVFAGDSLLPDDNDLTRNGVVDGEPIGTRLLITGRVTTEEGQPLSGVLVEIWQANASGRYYDEESRDDAPIDPNFFGTGRCLTDRDGHYRFRTIRPGNYPVLREANRWRPAHIHFSLYGPSFLSRLVTQLYFPDDPLLATDRVFGSIPDGASRERLIAKFSPEVGEPKRSLGYVFDIVMRDCRIAPQEG